MAVTVRDCMNLPVFKDAKVVGGFSGIDSEVKAVSVIETTNLDEMLVDLAQGNELIITAFFDARDDVQKQCKVIRMLKRCREAAIVLFYVGILVPEIHPDLISTADEIGMPLICMPPMRYDLSYADTISAVMELVIKDRMYPMMQLLNEIIYEFSKAEIEQQSLQYAVQLIAQKLSCGIIIFNSNLNPLLLSNVPNSVYYTLDGTIRNLLNQGTYTYNKYGKFNIRIEEKSITVYNTPIQIEKHSYMYLYIIDYNNNIYNTALEEIAELIKLCSSIWRYNPIEEAESRLVQTILNKDSMLVNLIANKFNICTANICGFLQIKHKLSSLSLLELQDISRKLKNNMENLSIRILSNEQQDCIEMILLKKKEGNNIDNPMLFDEIIKATCKVVTESNLIMIIILDIMGLEQFYEEYRYIKRAGDVAQLVYPYKRNLTKYDIRFAEYCLNLTSKHNGELIKFKELLKPLSEYDLTHTSNILETLAVYILDTGLNTQQTARILFLHPNTVQYRIKKAESILKANISYTLLLLMLSVALGIYRISIDNKKESE